MHKTKQKLKEKKKRKDAIFMLKQFKLYMYMNTKTIINI